MEAQYLLSLAKGMSEEAEVFWVHSRRTPVRFEANRLKQIQSQETTGVALRLIKGGRIGFSAGGGEVAAQTLIDMAAETAQFGMAASFSFPSDIAYPVIEVFDPEIDTVTSEKMVELGEKLVTRLKEHTPDIVSEVEVVKEMRQVQILNSRGGEVSYRKSFFALSAEGVVIQDTDMLFVGDGESSCQPLFDFGMVAERVINQLELAKRKATVSTKPMPVVFTPRGVGSALIAPLLLAFNGKIVLEEASPLKDRLGEEVFDKKFSLQDDATLPYRPASRPCDDEGVPSQSIPLVTEGVVMNFLYDLHTAALAKTRSTGSGNRARGGPPAPSVTSLIIDRGSTSFEDMIKDMKEGLVIEQVIGAEQGNLMGGDFSGNILLGYKVERGEIVGRVKDTMVSGNVYQILRHLEAVGSERRWVGGLLFTPALYCPRVSVAAKAV